MLRKTVVLSWIPTQDSKISKLKEVVVTSLILVQDRCMISIVVRVNPTQDSINLNAKKNSSPELDSYPR